MLTIDLYRNNVLLGSATNPLSASLHERINAADTLNLSIPESAGVQADDELDIYSSVNNPDVTPMNELHHIGLFIVETVEEADTDDGRRVCKVTAKPAAAYYLINCGSPGNNFINSVDEVTAAGYIVNTLQMVMGKVVIIGFVNPLHSDREIKPASQQTLLEMVNEIVKPSNSRWRCRPDLTVNTIEVGHFGDVKPIQIRHVNVAVVPATTHGVYFTNSCVQQASNVDQINSAFVEGGMWTDDKGKTTALLLWPALIVPIGYTLNANIYPDYWGYFRVDKDLDENGNPFPLKKSRRVVFSGIVPKNTGSFPPSGAQVVAASQVLLDTICEYLTEVSILQRTWNVTVPGEFVTLAHVGDKIHLTTLNTDGTVKYADEVFIASRTVDWNEEGKATTQLELSTRLESLVDPLSKEYGNVKEVERQKVAQSITYQASVTCVAPSGYGTYTFPSVYTAAPVVDNLVAPVGCTPAVTALDNVSVTIQVTGGGCVLPKDVTFDVTPSALG